MAARADVPRARSRIGPRRNPGPDFFERVFPVVPRETIERHFPPNHGKYRAVATDRLRVAPGASSGGALTGSLSSRTHYPVSAWLPDGPLLFEPRAELRHWERQSLGNRVAARFRRKTVPQTRACRLERIRRYDRDHTESGFLSCALRWRDRAQTCFQRRHNNCRGFSERMLPRNASLRPS